MDNNIITLLNQATNEPRDFVYEHAVRLLTQQERSRFDCWNLPPDSKYIFRNGNLINRSSSRTPRLAKKQETPEEGETT